jgi:hypothetical protein
MSEDDKQLNTVNITTIYSHYYYIVLKPQIKQYTIPNPFLSAL